MKVLVTGATGFIGHHLVKELVKKGHHCHCLVRKTSKLDSLRRLPNVTFFYGDITKRKSLTEIGEEINAVYHLAAAGHVSAISKEAFEEFKRINVEGTKNLIQACLEHPIKKFIHFSSTAAMGLIKRPIVDENTPCQPSTPYQKAKRESELVALSFWEKKRFPVVILRPCMIYGPGGKGEFLKLCRLMKKGIFPKVGFGKNLTPLVFVTDVVQAAILASENGKPGETYLVAAEQSYVLEELREIILETLGVRKPYIYIPAAVALWMVSLIELWTKITNSVPLVTRKNIESTITDRVFSIQKAIRELGYQPSVDLYSGIRQTISWYRTYNLL